MELILQHVHDIEIIEPCCSARGSSGYIECGCGGMQEVVCHAPDCPGVDEESELESYFDDYDDSSFDCD